LAVNYRVSGAPMKKFLVFLMLLACVLAAAA
jgi:hypothetical protein